MDARTRKMLCERRKHLLNANRCIMIVIGRASIFISNLIFVEFVVKFNPFNGSNSTGCLCALSTLIDLCNRWRNAISHKFECIVFAEKRLANLQFISVSDVCSLHQQRVKVEKTRYSLCIIFRVHCTAAHYHGHVFPSHRYGRRINLDAKERTTKILLWNKDECRMVVVERGDLDAQKQIINK